jgi:hypothetical protein
MKSLTHSNLQLNLLREPKNTYIFDELKNQDLDEVMFEGSFFNN